MLSAGTTGGPFAIEQMVRTLSGQGALVVATLAIAGPVAKMSDERLTDKDTLHAIGEWAGDLIRSIDGTWVGDCCA